MSKVPKAKQRITTKRKISIVFLGAMILVAGLLVYRATVHHAQTEKQFKQDKVRFAQTEKDMADAYAAIVQTAGQPYETKLSKGCAYGALKYARGPLGCMITRIVAYDANSMSESKIQGERVLATINGHYGFAKGEPHFGLSDLNQQSGQFTLYLDDVNELGCSLTHDTYSLDEYNSFGKNLSSLQRNYIAPYVSVYSLRCDRNVPKAIYETTQTPK